MAILGGSPCMGGEAGDDCVYFCSREEAVGQGQELAGFPAHAQMAGKEPVHVVQDAAFCNGLGAPDAFLRWLDDFEHDKLGLPRPDLVLYLDMPTEKSVELLRGRESATHTKADIHELDTEYLATCRACAHQAIGELGWKRISCLDREGQLRSIQEIHQEIWSLVTPLL